MVKPDVIVVNPTHVDFPLFRYQIRKCRHMYDKVIIGFSEHRTLLDIQLFMQEAMVKDDVTFVAQQSGQGDWRDKAIKACLKKSTSSHVLFLEQDFIIQNSDFLDAALNLTEEDRPLGFKEGSLERLHPAFLLISREELNRTSLNFGAKPPGWDHFGKIEIDLRARGVKSLLLEDLSLISPNDWEHLAGMTHNYTLLMEGEPVVYQVDRFARYNRALLDLDIEQDPRFLDVIREAAQL